MIPKNGTIYLKPVGGLCNRMRAIDSCVSLAHRQNKQVVVFWGRDQFLNCRFSDLFEPSEHFRVIEEKQWIGKKALYPYLPGSCPTSAVKAALFRVTENALGIDTKIWFEDLDQVIARLRPQVANGRIGSMRKFEQLSYPLLSPFVSQLSSSANAFICSAWRVIAGQSYKANFIPVKAIRNKIDAVSRQFIDTTGVHIRRSDHELAIRYSNLDKFKEAIQSELDVNATRTIFLATDSIETENALKQLYPGKIHSYKKSSYSRASVQGVQDAVVDLYCLANTRKILGSYFSSFSQVAAEISGIEECTVS